MGDWISKFGLSADPFDPKTSSGLYYGGPYGVASLRLEQALRQRRGFVVVTGEAGLGKTALVRNVLARRAVFASASVSCAKASPGSAIEQLLVRAEPFAGAFSKTRRRAALLSMVEQAKLAEKPIVLIIEDAHLADPVQLEDLRVALRLDTAVNDVVQVILVGRLKLAETLATRTLRELARHVVATVTLAPMSADESVGYLKDRLSECGADHPDRIFTADAIMAVARHSGGVVTKCATLARESLARAADADARVVTPDFVADAAALVGSARSERDEFPVLRRPKSYRWLAGPVGAVAAILVLAIAVAATQVNLMDPWGPAGKATTPTKAAVGALPEFKLPPAIERDPSELVQLAERGLREEFLQDTPYEVTITPPKQPGSSERQSGVLVPGGTKTDDKAAGIVKPAETVGPTKPGNAAKDKAQGVPQTARTTPPAKLTGSLGAPTGGAHHALQVAAFRSVASANELKERLERQFKDVYISKITSGGDPLYRVRVGKFADAADTHALRQRLQVAGYASFRVTE